jgi:hypothetical protein
MTFQPLDHTLVMALLKESDLASDLIAMALLKESDLASDLIAMATLLEPQWVAL